jgi:MFS family permease
VLILVVPFFGLGFGGLVVLWPLAVGHNFGLKAFGTIAGVMGTVSVSVTGALGPIALGAIYDTTGSYDGALVLCIGMFVCGAGVALVTPAPLPE